MYMHICIYIYIYTYIDVCIDVCAYECMCVSMCLCAYAGRTLSLWINEAITNKTLMRKATGLLESAGVHTCISTCTFV